MKVDGEKFDNSKAIIGPHVIRRGDKLYGFYAEPIWSRDDFDARMPVPENSTEYGTVFTKEGKRPDPDSQQYKEILKAYNRAYWGWMILTSLAPSKIKFDDVSIDDPGTWINVEKALRAQLGHYEASAVFVLVEEANSIDSEKLAANLESFLSEKAAKAAEALTKDGNPTSKEPAEAKNT